LERGHDQIKLLARVGAIIPNEDAIIHMVGAMPLEPQVHFHLESSRVVSA
jgi:hypothetical protein